MFKRLNENVKQWAETVSSVITLVGVPTWLISVGVFTVIGTAYATVKNWSFEQWSFPRWQVIVAGSLACFLVLVLLVLIYDRRKLKKELFNIKNPQHEFLLGQHTFHKSDTSTLSCIFEVSGFNGNDILCKDYNGKEKLIDPSFLTDPKETAMIKDGIKRQVTTSEPA